MPKVHFSESGLAALRLLALDRRYMDPQKFAHVRAELGLEATIEWPSARHRAQRVEINIDDGLKRLGGRDASKQAKTVFSLTGGFVPIFGPLCGRVAAATRTENPCPNAPY